VNRSCHPVSRGDLADDGTGRTGKGGRAEELLIAEWSSSKDEEKGDACPRVPAVTIRPMRAESKSSRHLYQHLNIYMYMLQTLPTT
jgi:hypothetical protein